MQALMSRPPRHPWLDALIAHPEQEITALVEGYADIFPYNRGEPADSAVALLAGVEQDDPAHVAFDQGCLVLLETLRSELLTLGKSAKSAMGNLARALAVIRRVRPPITSADLHRRYPYWLGVFETAVLDRGLDLRRDYWRTLALTQDVATGQKRRLMAHWLQLCAEAGRFGRFDNTYLDVGLVGLGYLPLGQDHDSNEEAMCHGLARWSLRQRPTKADFLARWREIESAYPRAPDYWPPLVADVIRTLETTLHEERDDYHASFPAASWWREDTDAPSAGQIDSLPRQRNVPLPAKEEHLNVLSDLSHNLEAIEPRIRLLMRKHAAYADATGDVFYLVRTACKIGMALRDKGSEPEAEWRGALAADLARQALSFEPSNIYAWSLWGYGLEDQKLYEAAEIVRWETVFRFPENPQNRGQLANLLDKMGRVAEARQVLEDTLASFPNDSSMHNLIGKMVVDEDLDRAEQLFRDAIRLKPHDFHAYAHLARLLSDRRKDRPGALKILDDFLTTGRDSSTIRELREKLLAGEHLRFPPPRRTAPTAGSDFLDDAVASLKAGPIRRALFLAETSTGDAQARAVESVRQLLVEDPGMAYARYVAMRLELETANNGDSSFAFAFDRALRGDKAEQLESLKALVSKAEGIERYIGSAGLAIMAGQTAIDTPTPANEVDEAASSFRFNKLILGITPGLRTRADPRPFLRLLADFSVADLAPALVA
jgi:tetratricopeptide (TPR) repeat protein